MADSSGNVTQPKKEGPPKPKVTIKGFVNTITASNTIKKATEKFPSYTPDKTPPPVKK